MARVIQFRKASISRSSRWAKLARDCQFDEKEMARRTMVSVRQLQRHFKEQMGRTPKAWLNEQRMIVARKLLQEGCSVKATASQTGFKQASHFCREFKHCYEMTPRQYVTLYNEVRSCQLQPAEAA